MAGSGGGINQRLVRGLEPSPGMATSIYLVVVALLLWALSSGVVPRPIRGFAPLVIGLIVVAIVVYGLRWITFRRVLSMSRDPQLAADMPDVVVQTRGPFAPPQPRPVVVFSRPPRMFAGLGPRSRVTVEHGVLGRRPMHIVYLRVFDNRPRARTFARGAWREFGYVYLLRSAAAVSLTELTRRRNDPDFFIRSEAQLCAELDRAPTAPQPAGWRRIPGIAGSTVLTYDRYGGYPVRTPMCHGGFWTTALDVLLERADLVVLDLSGYHTKYEGTQFEIQRLVDTVPIRRVVLLADPKSNRRFIQEQVELAWAHMDARSPNVGTEQREIPCHHIDYFLVHQDEHNNTTRTELRASRTQTRALLRDAQVRLETPPGETGVPPPRPQVWPRVAVAAGVVVVAALALAVVSGRVDVPNGPASSLWFPSGTSASVVPGSGYNIRAGPSTATPVVEALPAGTEVVVECTAGNWARLGAPVAGAYIHTSGLLLRGRPGPC